MSRQIIRRRIPERQSLPDTMHPVLRRVYAARDIQAEVDIDYALSGLLPYHQLSHIDAAVDLLIDAIERYRHVLVVGDFDADGATSTALAIRGLSLLGVEHVSYLVPNRFEYGYGLTPEIVDVALRFEPDMIITVDNGISSFEGVAHARKQGVDVMITDHHLPAGQLPAANVIINPQLADDAFPSKHLAGVGVMFYVLLALRAGLKTRQWFEKQSLPFPNLARLLDLVALGTVADMVPLDKNNRILIAHGLKLIQQGKCVPGIIALLECANKTPRTVQAGDLGFSIAPRLNAAGRLTDMSQGIECLLTDDPQQAGVLARQLDSLNIERKQIQDEMQAQAMLKLDRLISGEEIEQINGVCLYHPEWHQGVIGILAARIKEKFHRPVIAFARERQGMLKGSARSIPGLHIRDTLELISSRQPGLIINFGGHAMAAGLSIKETDLDNFKANFHSALDEKLASVILNGQTLTDGELPAADMTLQLAELLRSAGPWGQAFPAPRFDGEFRLADRRIVGGGHLKMKLIPLETNRGIDAIAFNMTDESWPDDLEYLRAVYRLDINEYQSRKQLQLLIEHIQPL